MVLGANPQENGEKHPPKGGPTASGQSVSTSGSVGSPSIRSEAGVATPASESTLRRLSHLEIQADDAGSSEAMGAKKKRGKRIAGDDKSGRGLRQFSMKVCEKVQSKGRTTYNEQFDEKNIWRRVYDALNVLMAMDIMSKDKKEIQWRGLPRLVRAEQTELRNRIEKRAAYLQELEEQYTVYQELTQRNQRLYGSGNGPSGGVALPFILV
ncbi:Transcription factor-like protein, partial [Drosera capensis]